MPNDVINTITINNNTYDIGGTGCGKAINMTLSANSWDANNRQSLQFSGYRSGQSGVIGMPTSVTSAQKSAYQNADISIYSQSSDTFTFECGGTVPSIDLPVSLFITDLGGGSGGSGGHTIEDADGTDMTQRTNLQFLDAGVTDDSTDDVTKIENVQVIDDEDDLEDAPDGIYMGDWDDADAVIDASIVGYDNTDSGLEATDVQGAVDELASNKVDAVQGKGLSTNDYDNTDKAKVDKINETTQSATGNPISISGLKSNQLAIDPIITLEPIQAGSGTPSPSNVRAISGYDKIEVLSCGVNVWDGKYSEENKFLNADGTLTSTNGWYVTSYVPVKANTSYTVSYAGNGLNGSSMCWYNSAKEFIASKTWSSAKEETISMPSNAKYLRVSYHSSTYNFQIEENNTKTTYEPCNKTTDLSESLGQTVYGGSLDVRTGKLTVTHKIVDMGDLIYSYYDTVSNNPVFQTVSVTDRLSGANLHPYICECYDSLTLRGTNNTVSNLNIYDTSTNIYVTDNRYTPDNTGATNLKTALSGVKLCYELKDSSKFTIQLTPHEISLLKDYAYVSTNGTSIALDYHNGELASLADVAQLGETVNNLGDTLPLKFKQVYLSASDIGTSFSPTAIRVGSIVNLFGADIDQSRIAGITICQAPLNPASILHIGFFNNNVYIAATQNTVLDGGFWVNILYVGNK